MRERQLRLDEIEALEKTKTLPGGLSLEETKGKGAGRDKGDDGKGLSLREKKKLKAFPRKASKVGVSKKGTCTKRAPVKRGKKRKKKSKGALASTK